ncbi:MAG: phosphoribosylformylglycinamidine synthase subunit PurQ, partial [Spirochaetaceae bacterium]|nr:phosphoribosylformylglycinamidine synthase subunit PurQ [Spirochaetaceae bacterium]
MNRVRVRVCVLGGFGINADEELAAAFEAVGARAERVHVTELTLGREPLAAFGILALPGGFTYGDHLGSATAMAALLRRRLRSEIDRFLDSGRLVVGICNGFQILVRAGLLPAAGRRWQCQASLIHNESGRFEDRWVRVGFEARSPCVWTRGLSDLELPVRHGEGRLVFAGTEVQSRLEAAGHVCVRYRSGAGGPPAYPGNPNGSTAAAAGPCGAGGRGVGGMARPGGGPGPVT